MANTAGSVDGKLLYVINGICFVHPTTPMKLAEYYGLTDKVFKYNVITDEPPAANKIIKLDTIVVNGTFCNFVEIVWVVHSWHIDGYYFAVGIDTGRWTPKSHKNYNLLDVVSCHTIQVYPLDNAGLWNVRSHVWERQCLGQRFYFSQVPPR